MSVNCDEHSNRRAAATPTYVNNQQCSERNRIKLKIEKFFRNTTAKRNMCLTLPSCWAFFRKLFLGLNDNYKDFLLDVSTECAYQAIFSIHYIQIYLVRKTI